ncbi:pilin [Variovorax sp. ZS18.2.2]|nr:pilin [Variovorax sp. ZS18.2.2]
MQVSENAMQNVALTGIDSGTGNIPAATDVTGKYVASTAVNEGVITATMQAAGGASGTSSLVAGGTLVLRPAINAGSISWSCEGTIDAKYRPKNC